jgi:hypothetical protein
MSAEFQQPDRQQPGWATDLHSPRWLWFLLLALPIVAIAAFIAFQSTQILPRIALAPAFSLPDQDGKTLTNENLRGALTLYALVDGHCKAPCPDPTLILQELQAITSELDLGDIPLQFVTVTTGPTHSSPQSLRAYADAVGADPQQWHIVRSSPEQFATLRSTPVDGEPLLALVDGWGIVRALYPTASGLPELEVIKHDLRLVAREAHNSSGANHYAYEAVHLFMCHNSLGD